MGTEVFIKNGEKILIRDIVLRDSSKRHEFFYELTLAQVGMVHTIDEIDIHAHETHDHIRDFLHNRRGLWLVAINEQEKIVGEVDITIKNLLRIRHNGNLTIGIVPGYQNQGLGTILMQQAFSWAKAQRLLRLELSVFKSNTRAIKLYQNGGFIVEGVRKNFLRLIGPNEAFEDDIMMAKYFE